MTSPYDLLLRDKMNALSDARPDLVYLRSLLTLSRDPVNEWDSHHLPPVLYNHGLPRPVGLAGRSAEVLECAAATTVFGLVSLSVKGKQRLAARFWEAVSWRSVRRSTIAAVHRVALALSCRGLLLSYGVPARIRTSVPEAVFECVVTTLTENFLPTGPSSFMPPYYTMRFLAGFNWPKFTDGMWLVQKPGIYHWAEHYAY